MNCNSNTMPLIDTGSAATCNNGCTPKDINVICRSIIIPNGQEILGVKGDLNSITRNFLIPKITEEGFDLSDKSFSIILQNSQGEQWKEEISSDNIEEIDNYIKITWKLTSKDTQVSGELKLLIRAYSTDFIWQTYIGSFIIQQSLISTDDIPTIIKLQEKSVIPKRNTQIVSYDEGYDGLKSVTVEGDNSLLPANIVYNKSIFNINGLFSGDGNIDSNDIVKDKIAYSKGEKIIGTFEGVDTSDATAEANDILEGKTAYSNGQKIVGTYEPPLNNASLSFSNSTTKINYQLISMMDISEAKDLKIKNMSFSDLGNLKTIKGLELVDTSDVTSMSSMFSGCGSLTSLNLSNFNTNKVTSIVSMFASCQNLTDLNVENFNIEKVTSMAFIFSGCNKLINLDLSGWNMKSVTNIAFAFASCYSLSDDSLNSILKMCSTAEALSQDKRKLSNFSLSNSQIAKCLTLSNWSLAENAGWVTGI